MPGIGPGRPQAATTTGPPTLMPASLDPHAIAVMLLTLAALVLFAQERLRIETSALFVFTVLVVGLAAVPVPGQPWQPRWSATCSTASGTRR